MLHTQIILDTLLIGSFLLIPKQEPRCLWRPTWMASRESIKLLDPIQIFGSVNRTVTLWVCPAQHLDNTWRLLCVFPEDFILCLVGFLYGKLVDSSCASDLRPTIIICWQFCLLPHIVSSWSWRTCLHIWRLWGPLMGFSQHINWLWRIFNGFKFWCWTVSLTNGYPIGLLDLLDLWTVTHLSIR